MCDFPAGWLLMSFLFYPIKQSCNGYNDDDNDDYYYFVFARNLWETSWFQVLSVRYNHNALDDPSFCRVAFLFIPGQGAQAASICPSDCSQGTAISGSQYNASPVPSEPTMQNANHNPSTCLTDGTVRGGLR